MPELPFKDSSHLYKLVKGSLSRAITFTNNFTGPIIDFLRLSFMNNDHGWCSAKVVSPIAYCQRVNPSIFDNDDEEDCNEEDKFLEPDDSTEMHIKLEKLIKRLEQRSEHTDRTPIRIGDAEIRLSNINQLMSVPTRSMDTNSWLDDEIVNGLTSLGKILGWDKNVFVMNSQTVQSCLLYTSPSPRDQRGSRMPSSA